MNGSNSNQRDGNTEDEDDHEGEDNLGLTDPRNGYKTTQGVDDGQVDLNLWPDHCVSIGVIWVAEIGVDRR